LETLIPDFGGNEGCIAAVIETKPEIISHNMETVSRLTPLVRSAAGYERSLKVLKQIGASKVFAKTGLMLGLGETETEVLELMEDVLLAGCYFLSIGQYLQPSRKHLHVEEYIHPEVFEIYKKKALSMGFRHLESGPLVRSSYRSAGFLS
jgi:lipoic acid synthetase